MALPAPIPTHEPAVLDPEGGFEQTLTVTGWVEIAAQVVLGHINVSAADVATVRVRATIRAHSGIVSAAELDRRIRSIEARPPIEQHGNIIKIGHFADREIERNLSISYDLMVPYATRLICRASSGSIAVEGTVAPLDAATASGTITAADISGDVRAAAAAGEIEIQSVRGRVTLSTGSGPIVAGRLTGPLRAASASGSVTIEHVASGDLQVTTGSGPIELRDVGGTIRAASSSGSIDVQGGQGEGAWMLETASGTVSVRLPLAVGFDLRARTFSGAVDTLRPLSSLRVTPPRQVQGRAGNGGLQLELATVTGNIHLE
jgi:hypothetical protein